MQCNQGKWRFELTDYSDKIILNLYIPRNIATSLIDVDVQPSYCSVIVKNKIFRIEWPEEVSPDEGKAERSQTTGALCVAVKKIYCKQPTPSAGTNDKSGTFHKSNTTRLTGINSNKMQDDVLEASKHSTVMPSAPLVCGDFPST
jgi:protein TilB